MSVSSMALHWQQCMGVTDFVRIGIISSVIATAISFVIFADIAMVTAKYHYDLYSQPDDRPADQRAE